MRRKTDRITSTDVARFAGISQSTVSRVFTNPDLVRPDTRNRVLAAAKALGYERTKRVEFSGNEASGLIGVIVKDFQNPFYTSFIHQISQQLRLVGKKVILFGNGSNSNILDILMEAESFQLSGLIIASTSLSEQLTAQNLPTRTPVVLVNRQEASNNFCSVASDDIGSSRFVADYFVRKGFSSFALIAGSEEMQSSKRRQEGYIRRLEEWGFYHVIVERGDYTYESGFRAMQRLIDRQIGVRTAILCANDLMGLGAIDAIRRVPSLSIPGDFSLIGFDDIEESRWHCYGLSSMRIPVTRMIDTTFTYLNTYYSDQPSGAGKHLFPCVLQERRTT